MKMRVNKFLENAAEILVCCAGGFLSSQAAVEAGIVIDNPDKFDFSVAGAGLLGAACGLAIIKGLIKDLKKEQTEDSFLQFDGVEPKKSKLKK
jgi:hypothetical protein